MNDCDLLLKNACVFYAEGGFKKNQTVAIKKGKIYWCGNNSEAENYSGLHYDCQNKLLTPGLIDCHTHLVYAGSRADEFRLRLQGMSYQDIALQGGGILSTVRQTRAASKEELIQQSLPRILGLAEQGVTTVEIKSGYGLDLDTEIKMLQVARELGKLSGLRVRTTFLGAHALPPEFTGNSDAYVDYLCDEVLPAVAESDLADAVDVFCESIGFNLTQTERIFLKTKALGLPLKCHAEQLSNLGASKLAAGMGALSSDHLEHLDKSGIEAMVKSGTVAVLLPGAYYFLGESVKPPVALLREYNVPMAVATDCNPGSSPTVSLQLVMGMACHFFGLTIEEAFSAVTVHAAKALGLSDVTGAIAPGLAADLICWDTEEPADLCYHFGGSFPYTGMIAGRWIHGCRG